MPLSLLPASQMDAYRVGWDTAEAESGTPKILVYSGVGTAKAYVYPLADAAYTMRLVVFRNPLVDLDFASHHAEQLEIARFAHLITNGVMYQAYLKQDADAYDPKKSEQHRVLWEGQDGHGGDKERIRRLVIKEKHRPEAANVTYAFM
jgi:hypothetical protein